MVVSVKENRLRAPFGLEISEPLSFLGHLSKVIEPDPLALGTLDRLPLDQAIDVETQRVCTTPCKCVVYRSPVHQKN
jgi:hypothetical protein